jgi:hypothetical protein
MTDDELAAIDARLQAATPGPWEVKSHRFAKYLYIDAILAPPAPDGQQVRIVETDEGCGPPSPADAELIAHAPTDLAALVAEVRRLQDERAALVKVMKPMSGTDQHLAVMWEAVVALVHDLRADNARLRERVENDAHVHLEESERE